MAFFSNFFNFFKPQKEPKVSAPHIKQKQRAITPPKSKPFERITSAIKKGLQKQKQKKEFIPTDYTPPVQSEPIKSPEERAEIYVQEALGRLDRKVQAAMNSYTNKDGSPALHRYKNNAVIPDTLEYQLQQIHDYIAEVIDIRGFEEAMAKLNRVDWDHFDSYLYYYPTCLDALPDVYAQITEATSPIEATSVYDSSAQSDFEDDEFNF